MKYLTTLLLAAMALTGCASQPAPHLAADDASMTQLNNVATQAQSTLQLLAQAKNTEALSQATPGGLDRETLAETVTPPGWERTISVHYEGGFYNIIEMLSKKAGYDEPFVNGVLPADQPTVTVAVADARLYDVLKKVMAQLPSGISINVFPASHSVVVNVHG